MFYIEGGEHQKEMPTRQRNDQVLMQKEDLFIIHKNLSRGCSIIGCKRLYHQMVYQELSVR